MARTVTRPVDEEEDDALIEESEWKEGGEEEASTSTGPVLSDSRRRKMLKRGEALPEAAPAPAATSEGKGRPTPSQRDEVVVHEGNFLTRSVERFQLYLKETWSELNKVTWPTREETRRLTYIVLAVTAVTAALLGIISFLFSTLTQRVADPATATIFGIITIVLIVGVALAWLFRERLPGAGRFE